MESDKNFSQQRVPLTLRPLQKEAVEKMINFLSSNPERGVYNASEAGCGKTAMTIATINNLLSSNLPNNLPNQNSNLKTLIICPSVVKLNWRDELNLWLNTDFLPMTCHIVPSVKDIKNLKNPANYGHIPSNFTIISYDLARKKEVAKVLASLKFDILILDEAHKCKATQSLTTNSVLRTIWPTTTYRICLSGTPFTTSIEDCWTTFSRLAPSKFPDYFSFVRKYCYEDRTPWGIKYYGLKNHEELRSIIRSHFFIRYTKEEMAPELPEKNWIRIPLSYKEYGIKPTKEELEAHKVYIALLEEAIGSGKAIPQPPVHFQTERKRQGLKKLSAVLEVVKDFVDNGIPTIVFFSFLETLQTFVKEMSTYQPSIIYGEVKESKRYDEIKRFQEGKTNLFISQIHAGGIGINLQRAEHVVLAEMEYSPAVIGQAVDRAHRIGQTKTVNIYYPVVEDTIEIEAEKIVMMKAKMFRKVLE